MKRKHLWILNPCLLAMLAPTAWADDQKNEDQLVVSANRMHRSATEMAQTTWVIESQKLNSRCRAAKRSKRSSPS